MSPYSNKIHLSIYSFLNGWWVQIKEILMDKNYDDFGVQIMSNSEVEFCCFLCNETFKVEEVWRNHVEAHEK